MNWYDLPELAFIQVLNYLSMREQLNTRLQVLEAITDSSARRDELVVFLDVYPRSVYWFHDGSEVDLGNAFLIADLAFLVNNFFLRYICRVRRLMIVYRIDFQSKQFIEKI